MKIRIVCDAQKMGVFGEYAHNAKTVQVLTRVEDEAGEQLLGNWEAPLKKLGKQVLVVEVPDENPDEKVIQVLLDRLKLILAQDQGADENLSYEQIVKNMQGMLTVTIFSMQAILTSMKEK